MNHRGLRIALVCDWLTNVGGAEKVLLEIHKLYPDAPIYTSQYRPRKIDWFRDAEVKTGWLQILPAGLRRFLGPLRQRWFSHLDLSSYDLVISVTGAEAKAVKTFDEKSGQKAVHLCYCHVPTQYYWQMYDDYVKNPGFGILNPVVRFCFKALVRPLRKADFAAAEKVDEFVTISEYARELIKKYYKREAKVIHPPVDTENFSRKQGKSCGKLVENSEEFFGGELYYIVTSRQVTWKRLELAVKACTELKRNLLVVGEGPEHDNLVKMAGESVRFLPLQGRTELARMLRGARGYIFPSMEPFGIAPVEALSAGCPVIAFGKGGARDYVVDGKNGVMFEKQTVKSLIAAILEFEKMKFDTEAVERSVEKFGEKRFDRELREKVGKMCDEK